MKAQTSPQFKIANECVGLPSLRDAMCVGRYEMNTERSGVFIEMQVTDAAHLGACRRYANPQNVFQVFHAFKQNYAHR